MYLVGSAHPNRESLETFLRSRPAEEYVTRLSARDCLHLAVMNAHRVSRILTFDHAFEHYPGVMRLPELDAV